MNNTLDTDRQKIIRWHISTTEIVTRRTATLLLILGLLTACQTATRSDDQGLMVDTANSDGLDLTTTPDTEPSPADPSTVADSPHDSSDPSVGSGDSPAATNQDSASITDPRLTEISGLASSLLSQSRLWAVNDSGQPAHLFAIKHTGEVEDVFSVAVENRDWESLTSFINNGSTMLLLADTGDNLESVGEYQLHLLAEPDTTSSRLPALTPVATIKFRYPDGAHNSEAVAVDERNQQIVLVTKSEDRRQVYTLPLNLVQQREVQTANFEGPLAEIPRTAMDNIALALTGIDLSAVTGLEIDNYGNAWALTYRGVYQWTRHNDESWGAAFARSPKLITRHGLQQAEAVALLGDTGELIITSEKLPAPLNRIDISPHLFSD